MFIKYLCLALPFSVSVAAQRRNVLAFDYDNGFGAESKKFNGFLKKPPGLSMTSSPTAAPTRSPTKFPTPPVSTTTTVGPPVSTTTTVGPPVSTTTTAGPPVSTTTTAGPPPVTSRYYCYPIYFKPFGLISHTNMCHVMHLQLRPQRVHPKLPLPPLNHLQ